MLMVYNAEKRTIMPVSIRVSLTGVKIPRFKHTKHPTVPKKQCMAVNVYGYGKSPANTILLYIVNARLQTK